MKNKSSKLLVLSLAALLGVACSPTILPSGNDEVGESILVDDEGEKDEIGVAVNLRRQNASSSDVKAQIGNYFGLQKIDEEGGKISVRFIAAVSGIDDIYSMYVKRSVADGDGVSVMEEKTIAIEKVYKSLTDADAVSWDGTNELSGDVYYAVYTLKNIPEAHLDDVINVEIGLRKWSGSSNSISLKANGTSFLHPATQIEGLTFVAGSSSNQYVKADEVYVNTTSTTLTEVEIPEKVYVAPTSYDKHVVKEATVVAIGNPSFSGWSFDGQGFYNCSKLSKVTLPKTIRTFAPYVFEKCTALEEIELPEGLTTIMDAAFGYKYSSYDYSCGVKRLLWNAKNLTTAPDFDSSDTYTYGMFSWVLDKVVIGENVESLPNYPLFGGGASTVAATLPLEVEWKKTEAQRSALLAAAPNSDLDVENYVCSDTQKVNLTYHLGEGTLSLDGEAHTGDYSKQVYGMGRKLAKPADPTPKAGEKFVGWYLDQAYAAPAEFPIVLGTEDVELFAKFEQAAEGEVASTPKALSMDTSITFTTSEAVPCQYFTFTATKEGSDYYYFQISDFAVAESSPNSTRLSYEDNIWIYTDSGYSQLITPNRNTPFVDKVNGYNNYQLNVLLAQGETAYIKVAAYNVDTVSTPRPVYGDITLTTFTQENDQTSEAIALTKGVEASYEKNNIHQDYISTFYSFTAEQSGYNLKLAQKGSHNVRAYARLYKDGSLVRSLASLTLSGASAETILSGLTVGDAYYLVVESDYLSTFEEGDGVSILLGDLPAGLTQENPIQGRLGGYNEVKGMSAKTRYYSFSLEEGKTYHLIGWRTSSSSSYSKPGCAFSLLAPSGKSEKSSKLFNSSYSDYGDISFTAAETGTYVVSADVVDSGTWSTSSHLSGLALVEEKAAFEESATYQNLDILCVKPSGKTIYNLTLGDAKLGKLTYSYSYPTSSSDIYTGDATITLSANTASFFQVKTEAEGGVTIKAEKAKAALEGKPYVNVQYNGMMANSPSYWKFSIDEYGVSSGESAFRNGIAVKELSVENGIYALEFTYSGVKTKGYTDGTRIYAHVSSEEWFCSKDTSYSSSAVGAKTAKTSDYAAGGNTGVEILSILEGSTRIYCAIVNGNVYLNAVVEFSAGSDVSAAGSAFTVKDSEGNAIGNYKVESASTLTIVE